MLSVSDQYGESVVIGITVNAATPPPTPMPTPPQQNPVTPAPVGCVPSQTYNLGSWVASPFSGIPNAVDIYNALVGAGKVDPKGNVYYSYANDQFQAASGPGRSISAVFVAVESKTCGLVIAAYANSMSLQSSFFNFDYAMDRGYVDSNLFTSPAVYPAQPYWYKSSPSPPLRGSYSTTISEPVCTHAGYSYDYGGYTCDAMTTVPITVANSGNNSDGQMEFAMFNNAWSDASPGGAFLPESFVVQNEHGSTSVAIPGAPVDCSNRPVAVNYSYSGGDGSSGSPSCFAINADGSLRTAVVQTGDVIVFSGTTYFAAQPWSGAETNVAQNLTTSSGYTFHFTTLQPTADATTIHWTQTDGRVCAVANERDCAYRVLGTVQRYSSGNPANPSDGLTL